MDLAKAREIRQGCVIPQDLSGFSSTPFHDLEGLIFDSTSRVNSVNWFLFTYHFHSYLLILDLFCVATRSRFQCQVLVYHCP